MRNSVFLWAALVAGSVAPLAPVAAQEYAAPPGIAYGGQEYGAGAYGVGAPGGAPGCYPHCPPMARGSHCGFWSKYGLPDPRYPSGDMPPHIPYIAQPKNYYYFRPYNHTHIPVQQQEVRIYGGDPRHPYDNKVLKNIYDGIVDLETIDDYAQATPLRALPQTLPPPR